MSFIISKHKLDRTITEITYTIKEYYWALFQKLFFSLYLMEEKTINNIHENKSQVSCNVVNINNYPHNILEQVQQLINDTLAKEQRIKELEIKLKSYTQ